MEFFEVSSNTPWEGEGEALPQRTRQEQKINNITFLQLQQKKRGPGFVWPG